MSSSLADLSKGFRKAYLNHADITAQLEAWVAAYPTFCKMTSLAKTPEGRDVWLLTIGRDLDRIRPAAWVDGNMHAAELAGSSVALAIAEDVLRLHVEPNSFDAQDVPTPIADRLREIFLYVVPRISPDGAEAVLTSGRSVRSVPRDQRVHRGEPRWVHEDIDGDGQIRSMRVKDPGGELFDGKKIPSPNVLGDNPIDLNRNFPWSWAPHHEQVGAGAFATSEPEARGIVEFATAHPNIFAWCDFHTFGGVMIRPLGHAPDAKMNQEDLAIFRQLEAWMTEHTGYPTVSGHEEFLYEPDKPLRGDLTDYAYNQRGAIGYVVELWDLFARLGMPRPPKFAQYYERVTRHDLVRLAWWDREENHGRSFPPWRTVDHPQLGPVEVGGIDPRVGIWNPPPHELPVMCATQSQMFLRVAALAPRLRVGRIERFPLAGDLTRVEIEILNDGYLGTYGLPSAKTLDFNEPVYATAKVFDDAELVDSGRAHQVLGHLDGWGHGLHTGANLPAYPGTRGTTHLSWAHFLVRGRGRLEVRAGSCRVGFLTISVTV
jgi:hypothetical protein